MKKTITGWILREPLANFTYGGTPLRLWPDAGDRESDSVEVTITYDDGKPATKTVWEWMWRAGHGPWQLGGTLHDEAEAAHSYAGGEYKKLRSFEVEE